MVLVMLAGVVIIMVIANAMQGPGIIRFYRLLHLLDSHWQDSISHIVDMFADQIHSACT
jgi:hypothetical protein